MVTTLFSIYLKWNLLLGAVLLLWVLLRRLGQTCGYTARPGVQLRLARWLFAGLLLLLPLVMLSEALQPGLVNNAGMLLAGEMSIGGTISQGLGYSMVFGSRAVTLSYLLMMLVFVGLVVQMGRLLQQFVYLRRVVSSSTEWKRLGCVQLLISDKVATPFSTRALGRNQIVLPFTLLGRPEYLRLSVQHELQHLRNGDLDWILMMEVVKVLCGWNPAIHLWHREFDNLQEFACDEALLGQRRVGIRTYGHCLLELATASQGAALLAASNMVPRLSLFATPDSQLKRRISMFNQYTAVQGAGSRLFAYAMLAAGGLLGLSALVFGADGQPAMPIENINEASILPTSTTQPRYPARAMDDRLEGWVLVNFTVTPTGTVSEPSVIDGCVRQEAAPCIQGEDVFDANSLAAVSQFTFEPRLENGVAVAVPDVRYVFRYSLKND
jgi:TonB family protein